MLKRNTIKGLAITMAVVFGCNSGPEFTDPEDIVLNEILPETFSIAIPSALSFKSELIEGGVAPDLITAEGVYSNVRTYIAAAEARTRDLRQLLDEVIAANVDSAASFSIVSDLDSRTKNYSLKQRVSVDGESFRYLLEVEDEDGSRAAQIFWKNSPDKIIAILRPADINRDISPDREDEMIKIVYDEDDPIYNESMTIYVTGLSDGSGINKLQLLVGNKSDKIEVQAHFNAPDLMLIDPSFTGGRNFAVAGRTTLESNLAVAKVALPPSAVDNNDAMFESFALMSILTEELQSAEITDQELIDIVTLNAAPPAFFAGDNGFVSSGLEIPDNPAFSPNFNDLSSLDAFVPRDIRDLEILFDEG